MARNENRQKQGDPQVRIRVLQVLFVTMFVVYGMKLFSMQILSSEQHITHALDISRRTDVLRASRGEIFDRSFTQPLVTNADSFAVSIIPGEVPQGQMLELFATVAELLEIPSSDIEARITPQNYRLYQPVEIAANVPFSAVAALAERRESLPGVHWNTKPVRMYMDVGSLAHAIGYVGEITRDELTQLFNDGYQLGDTIGKTGIERQYDEFLRGKDGREIRVVDVQGKRIPGMEERILPEMGKNLVLTIDMRIQKLVEEALGERMGSIVVMRPSTGEILAMVSYPWYDPNIFTSGDRNEYTGLANDPNRPFLNRAIQASYPPASSFKMIMATGIISENAFPQDRLVECTGHVEFGGRTWRCHLRTGHGKLNLYGALGQSCNIYFWQVGRDNLGVDQIVAYSKDFGLGEITGIDIPGEIAGFIPTPAWKSRRFHERWMAGDTMNMAIGQGWTQVTPIQMVNVISMIVNGGTTYRPHLLKEARDPATGEVTWRATPEVMHSSGIDPEVFEVMRRDLRGVIAEGSASYPMNIRSVQIAGKTGTAEVGLNDRWHSWLVSYGPYNSDNPDEQVAVATIVEATNRWEWWATYATAIIYQGIFANQTASEAARTLGFPNVMPTLGRRE